MYDSRRRASSLQCRAYPVNERPNLNSEDPVDRSGRRTHRPDDHAGWGRAARSPAVARLRAAGCVFAEDEARLLRAAAGSPAELDAMVERRVAGVPLEARARLGGVLRAADRGRPRRLRAPAAHRRSWSAQAAAPAPGRAPWSWTCAAARARSARRSPPPLAGVELHAADIDPAAVGCARRNLRAGVYEGDLYAPLPERLRGRVDLLVVNAPYVPTAAIATMPPEARDHEPRVALDGGADGLDVQRRVAAEAPAWLRPGGHLLIETGADQAPHTAAVFAAAGLVPLVEYAEDATVVIGER